MVLGTKKKSFNFFPLLQASNAVLSTDRPSFYRPIAPQGGIRGGNSSGQPGPPGSSSNPRVHFFVRVPGGVGVKPGGPNVKIPNISHIQGKLKRLSAAITEGLASQHRRRVSPNADAGGKKPPSAMFDPAARGNYLEMLRKRQQETTTEAAAEEGGEGGTSDEDADDGVSSSTTLPPPPTTTETSTTTTRTTTTAATTSGTTPRRRVSSTTPKSVPRSSTTTEPSSPPSGKIKFPLGSRYPA